MKCTVRAKIFLSARGWGVLLFLMVWTAVVQAQSLPESVLINEFMAKNGESQWTQVEPLTDDDGEESDWIELLALTESLDLTGWALTDDADEPFKWTFPAGLVLEGGQYLVVFASGKDRAQLDSPLHTNFKLDRDGEYLALIDPNGTEVHAYSPSFPEQLTGVSYGIPLYDQNLVDHDAPVTYHVPGSSDGQLTWWTPQFDDISWSQGSSGFQFAATGPAQGQDVTDVSAEMLGQSASLWARYAFNLEDDEFLYWDGLSLNLQYEDGFKAYLNGTVVAGDNLPARWKFNPAAASDRARALGFDVDRFDLIPYRDLLQAGRNILAVHGLNDDDIDVEFHLFTELQASYRLSTAQYFATPTPGAANVGGTLGGLLPVEFSDTHGFYDQPFQLTLTQAEGAEIYYTTDGCEPTREQGLLYQGPLTIDRTCTLRATAVLPGFMSSPVVTQTCLFLADIVTQCADGECPDPNWPQAGQFNGQMIDYGMDPDVTVDSDYADQIDVALLSLPSLSLVTDLEHLFSESSGIYTHATSDGRDWERPVSLELIHPDGSDGFQINAGLRIRGGYSRSGDNPKHAFRLFFRSQYGAGKLSYPLFGDEGTDEFDKIDLRTSQNYSWSFANSSQNTLVREVFSRDTQGAMGHPYTRSRYVHLYLNGQYWGVYMTQERAEASYGATYLGGSRDDYDCIKTDSRSHVLEATDGDMERFRQLYDLTQEGFHDPARYLQAQGLDADGTPNPDLPCLLDPLNLVDFMILEYYTGDRDGPGSRFVGHPNNTFGLINRVDPNGFKWFHHDNEHTLGAGSSEENMVVPFTTAGSQWQYFNPHWQHEELMRVNSDYRMLFADRVYRHFYHDGVLTLDRVRDRLLTRVEQIGLAMVAESARWGDAKKGDNESPFTRDGHWWPEIERLLYGTARRYVTNRVDVVMQQFRAVDWLPTLEPPVFNQQGGQVSPGFELILSGEGTLYYSLDGSDPRVSAALSSPAEPVTLVGADAFKRYLVPDGPPATAAQGHIQADFFTDIYGSSVADLTGHDSYPASPSQTQLLDSFEIPTDVMDHYGTRVYGYLHPPKTGTYTFWIASDDGSELWLSPDDNLGNAEVVAYVSGWTSARQWDRYDSQQSQEITLVAGQRYAIEALQKEEGGGDNLAVAWAGPGWNRQVIDGACLSPGEPLWMSPDYDDGDWPTGKGVLGYETLPRSSINYQEIIDIGLRDAMYQNNATCYLRIPFTVNQTNFNGLTLQVQYDDGFVAYLNGTEVARALAPASLTWNSQATGSHDDAQALEFQSFDLSDVVGLLRTGDNLLAIHALNKSSADSDFLLSVELIADSMGLGDISTTAQLYQGSIKLTGTTQVKARAYNGQWSALSQAIFTVESANESP